MHSGQGSYLEFTIPFVVDASGYTSKINGQLMHLDATTSLKFRSLLQCETLEVCLYCFVVLIALDLLHDNVRLYSLLYVSNCVLRSISTTAVLHCI